MAFKKIGNVLGKFSNTRKSLKQEYINKAASDLIMRFFPRAHIKVENKEKTIFISTKSSVLKNEIYLRKDKILSELQAQLGKNAPDKISFRK